MKAFGILLLCTIGNALAWGPTGHRVVGKIAEKHLDSAVKDRVDEILKGLSLARVSTWPDEIRSEPETYSHTFNWHFTDWKEEDHHHDETQSSGKLLTAINQHTSILKDPAAPDESKEFSLRFLVHLIGDLHQPLHVGNGLDRGGNKCRVFFHNQKTNLHVLWDEAMIDFTRLSYTELAEFISQGRSREEVEEWKKGSVLDWAQESKNLRSKIYPKNVGPSSEPMTIHQYCRQDITVTDEEMPKLSYEYSYKFIPVVEERLFQAGLRLAGIINESLR